MSECVLNFVITMESKSRINGWFNISYTEEGMTLTTKDTRWSSWLEDFPPSLDLYSIEVDNKKIIPQRHKIWKETIEYKEVTEDWVK